MTTEPLGGMKFLRGSTLNSIDVEVSSFPIDPTAAGTEVTFQVAAAWANELANEGIAATVSDAVLGADGRWGFRLSVAAFDTTALPVGPYWCAFVIETADGGRAHVPASGRLLVEILPAPTVPA